MSIYNILKAAKTDIAPDIMTLLMARKLNQRIRRCLPCSRGIQTMLHLADCDVSSGVWRDTMFNRVYHGQFADNYYGESGGGGIAMIADEPLLSGINFAEDDFTIYLVDVSRGDSPRWSNFIVGSENSEPNFSFGRTEFNRIGDYPQKSGIFGTVYGFSRKYRIKYVDVIRYNHLTNQLLLNNDSRTAVYPSVRPSDWSIRISCNTNASDAYGFTNRWVYGYLHFAAAARVYHSDAEVTKNSEWLRNLYDAW